MENTCRVVSYRNSTSNHNGGLRNLFGECVVSYRNSTSNHNLIVAIKMPETVVSYRNSTSNHNLFGTNCMYNELYLIEILHQTTTQAPRTLAARRCILSKFYIKPQHYPMLFVDMSRCILSKFYIKPQHFDFEKRINYSCILSKFYIKPQPAESAMSVCAVVSYRNSTSNHNSRWIILNCRLLYLIEILHQTTTCSRWHFRDHQLYLIEILHQTTTGG